MSKKLFGMLPTGEKIYSYTIKNAETEVEIMTRGATILRFSAFGTDIVGGFDTLEAYLADTSHQGAVIGRVANRIANAEFRMDGILYRLTKNDGENCLHGGTGYDYKVWNVINHTDSSISLSYKSADGEEGFPGALAVYVTYTLLDNNALVIDYKAIPDSKTPIALTNHAYFNLDGLGGDIKSHKVTIFANSYTEVDENLIPNGIHPSVKGTVFDFTEPHSIGERIDDNFIGYDHNFILYPTKHDMFLGKRLGLAAIAEGESLKMSVYTDQPGIQFYIGNFLGVGPDFKGGIKQIKHGAFCLETQTEPNCINHGKGFYNAGDVYIHTTVYKPERRNKI